ncbi:alpha/beta hydrolase family protein [Mycolicibacterium thermoresistibile]
MKRTVLLRIWVLCVALVAAGCSSAEAPEAQPAPFADTDVTFEADGLTIHGSYRAGADTAPAALLISESGPTDRNGDNDVVGPIGNTRQLADLLAERGVASLRYDKVGTGQTGLGPYEQQPQDVGSAVYTIGARAALNFLADQPATDPDRLSVYGLGEGAIHAMTLAGVPQDGGPAVHSLGLLQPPPGRYLDIITGRVRADGSPEALSAWLAAVEQARTEGTVPDQLPEGLGAILNPGNVKAVVEADRIDPLRLAAQVPADTPVLLTCSDTDAQSDCAEIQPMVDALGHTDLTVVYLGGVNHVLRDDPTDNVANYAQQSPLSPQVVAAVDRFVRQ